MFLSNHRKGQKRQKRSAISANILLLQRSRNFSALLDDVEMFFTCAFAFVWWRIVKNGSEKKEQQKNLTFLIEIIATSSTTFSATSSSSTTFITTSSTTLSSINISSTTFSIAI